MTETQNTQTPTKKDGHLVVYLAWPILAGVALAVVLAVSIGGIVMLATKFDLAIAGMAMAATFFITLGLGTVGVFLYAAREFAGPRSTERVETIRQTVEYVEPDPVEPEVRFIPMGGRPARLNTPAPALPSGVANRAGIREAMTHLVDKLTSTATVTEVNTETQTLEPDAPGWVREMYTVLCASWPDRLTRREWNEIFDNGTALWRHYVNGDGSGRHAGRGIFEIWGIIAKRDGRGAWEYCHSLETIFGLDAELERYARAMAERVQPSPTIGLVSENTKKPVTKPTQPKTQTNYQTEGV